LEAGETERDGEFFRGEPVAPVKLALQDSYGGVAAPENGDTDAKEEAGNGGEARAGHRS